MRKEWKKIYSDDGILIYEGFTVLDKPYGSGEAYYPDGTVYREGIFGIKGLLCGKEYYPSGKLRLECVFMLNRGYGPNYPSFGLFRSEDESFTYKGEFTYKPSGTGYPIIANPEELGPVIQHGSPDLPALMWNEVDEAEA